MISKITKLLLVKLTITNPSLTLISSMALVGSPVPMPRRGEAGRHPRVGATAAIEPRRRSGDVGLMVQELYAMLAAYVCVRNILLNSDC